MASKSLLKIQELSFPKILEKTDDTTNFSCKTKEIDDFIQHEALTFQENLLGVTYLFQLEEKLIGSATLSMGHINRKDMAAEDRLPKNVGGYPALLIGQLGVCDGKQRNGVGTFICDFCLDRAIKLSDKLGCRFLVVDALESAVAFYIKYGFILAPKQEKQKLMFLDITKRTVISE